MIYIICYLVSINLIAFITYGVDKSKARKGAWRIPEKTLIMLAAVGGSIGAYAGMQVFRHKTKHALFFIGVPLIFIIQVVAVVYYWVTYIGI